MALDFWRQLGQPDPEEEAREAALRRRAQEEGLTWLRRLRFLSESPVLGPGRGVIQATTAIGTRFPEQSLAATLAVPAGISFLLDRIPTQEAQEPGLEDVAAFARGIRGRFSRGRDEPEQTTSPEARRHPSAPQVVTSQFAQDFTDFGGGAEETPEPEDRKPFSSEQPLGFELLKQFVRDQAVAVAVEEEAGRSRPSIERP